MKGIIIYATKHGCTEKAAKLLGSKLPGEIKLVNVEREEAPDLSLYDTVILGGPIYAGKTRKALSDYMRQNSEGLKKKRLALFICAGEQEPAKIEKLLAGTFPGELCKHAVARENFGGELHWDRLDFMTKLVLRVFIGIKEGYSRLSEEKIGSFAKGVAGVQG